MKTSLVSPHSSSIFDRNFAGRQCSPPPHYRMLLISGCALYSGVKCRELDRVFYPRGLVGTVLQLRRIINFAVAFHFAQKGRHFKRGAFPASLFSRIAHCAKTDKMKIASFRVKADRNIRSGLNRFGP